MAWCEDRMDVCIGQSAIGATTWRHPMEECFAIRTPGPSSDVNPMVRILRSTTLACAILRRSLSMRTGTCFLATTTSDAGDSCPHRLCCTGWRDWLGNGLPVRRRRQPARPVESGGDLAGCERIEHGAPSCLDPSTGRGMLVPGQAGSPTTPDLGSPKNTTITSSCVIFTGSRPQSAVWAFQTVPSGAGYVVRDVEKFP